MNLLITLTTAGFNSGPFNLYSNVDGYQAAFESDVPKQDLLDGYTSILVPDGTTEIRIQSNNTLCTTYINLYVIAPTTTSTTTVGDTYCVNWTAANIGGGKMSTQGYIDFSAILNGRTIEPGPLSVGTITAYRIFGETTDRSCNIEMDFTSTRATWDTSLLDAPAGTALYSLIYTLEVIFSDLTDYIIIDGQSYGTVTPGGTTSEYNNCPVPTTTTTTTATPTTTSTTTV